VAKTKRKIITDERWTEAADAYELGYRNTAQIAAELGVSRSTVSREFKRRGARKACRVHETVAHFEAALDAKARRQARLRVAQEAAAMERSAELDRLIRELMKSVIAAGKAGDLTRANPTITEISKALGEKPSR